MLYPLFVDIRRQHRRLTPRGTQAKRLIRKQNHIYSKDDRRCDEIGKIRAQESGKYYRNKQYSRHKFATRDRKGVKLEGRWQTIDERPTERKVGRRAEVK